MIHHYLQRGFSDEYILNLDTEQKYFYMASMLLYFEEERDKFKAMMGGA